MKGGYSSREISEVTTELQLNPFYSWETLSQEVQNALTNLKLEQKYGLNAKVRLEASKLFKKIDDYFRISTTYSKYITEPLDAVSDKNTLYAVETFKDDICVKAPKNLKKNLEGYTGMTSKQAEIYRLQMVEINNICPASSIQGASIQGGKITKKYRSVSAQRSRPKNNGLAHRSMRRKNGVRRKKRSPF